MVKMEHIYLLYGASNKGKSTTLKNLVVQLLQLFPNELVYFEQVGEIDFLAVWGNQKVRLGIYSGGDNKSIVFRNFSALQNMNCNFIIGATRTGGGSVQAAECYAELFGQEIRWIEKQVASDSDNDECQKELVKIVKKILKQ